MANTTNFGWETPDDTDLVKDGAAAMRTLGNSIDASFVDLKGGTTGQILSKNSNTDLDFTWIANDQGDITAVTAGTGLTGGGTSGAVTLTNDMATTITAAGDIVVGTGSGTYDNLPIGTTGQVLTADTTVSPYKVKWASVAAGGKLLQVVQGSITASASTTSDVFVDTGLSVTITPSSATSKVLLFAVHNSIRMGGNNVSDGAYFLLRRDSTDLQSFAALVGYTNSLLRQDGLTASVMYLDTPASTSALTYKTRYKSEISGNAVYTNSRATSYSTIVAMEIGA